MKDKILTLSKDSDQIERQDDAGVLCSFAILLIKSLTAHMNLYAENVLSALFHSKYLNH